LYLSISRIASFTHTHISQNIPSCAGNENGSQAIVRSRIAQINRNGITESTKNGCLKFQKCSTKTENISITQIPNAFNKSVIEFCISATSQAYSKATPETFFETSSIYVSISGVTLQRLVSFVLYDQILKTNFASACERFFTSHFNSTDFINCFK
jgi:hypothetical protein